MRFLRTFLLTSIPFGLIMGLAFGLVAGLIGGARLGLIVTLAGGAAAGGLFGLMMAGFVLWQSRTVRANPPHFDDEVLLHDGPANHLLNGEGVGGWLYLLRGRLYFRSHAMNLQPHELSIPLDQIERLRPVRSLGLIPNGLQLFTRSGAVEQFILEDRGRWQSEIAAARGRSPGPDWDGKNEGP